MEFKSHAKALNQFLKNYQEIMSEEIIDHFPQSLNLYDSNIYQDLLKLNDQELFEIDGKIKLPPKELSSLYLHYLQIDQLCQLNKNDNIPPKKLEDWAFRDVKHKKKHEIDSIAPRLKYFHEQKKFERIIDIGGGVGHLSRILAYYYSIESKCLDRDENFIKIGEERLKKFKVPIYAAPISFSKIEFGNPNDEAILSELIHNNHFFSVGLHTCGELSLKVINTTISNQGVGLLSFGCCYHKFQSNQYFPLSNYYKENFDLSMNLYAMTLATRAHRDHNFQNFINKKNVKYYRTALHLLLVKFFNLNHVHEVGEVHVREYSKSFSDYAISRLEHLKIQHSLSKETIEEFYLDLDNQKLLQEIFLKSLMRWSIGRPLEIYLLLDRAIYLEENNYEVKIEEYFDEALSPRNIGILAFKKS